MTGAFARVLRSEGLASVLRRAAERGAEWWRLQRMLLRGGGTPPKPVPLLNVCGMPVVARLGGVPIQLRARLQEEQLIREVALFQPGILELGEQAYRVGNLEEALTLSGARTIHVEGSFGLDLERVLRQPADLVLSLHDLSLLEQPAALRDALLARARAVIYPSAFLKSVYGVPGHIIEPALPAPPPGPARSDSRAQRGIACVGSLKPHKGAQLLPEIIDASGKARWHVFGGGDPPLLEALRGRIQVRVHGYYRFAQLPALLQRHRIGLVVLPSIVEESFSLVLSQCWSAGVPAIVFDRGAPADRIRQHGGGWCVPATAGAPGMAQYVRAWLGGQLPTTVPRQLPTPVHAAQACLAIYRSLE